MTTSVEAAIRSSVRSGEVLPTPTGTALFVVDQLDAQGLSLLFGPKKTRTLLTWRCLEGVPGYLRGKGWVLVGARERPAQVRLTDGWSAIDQVDEP